MTVRSNDVLFTRLELNSSRVRGHKWNLLLFFGMYTYFTRSRQASALDPTRAMSNLCNADFSIKIALFHENKGAKNRHSQGIYECRESFIICELTWRAWKSFPKQGFPLTKEVCGFYSKSLYIIICDWLFLIMFVWGAQVMGGDDSRYH